MGLFAKNITNITKPIERLVGGTRPMGAVEKAKDTRSHSQLSAALDYYSQINPEISQFISSIKKSKHLNLAVDIAEHANDTTKLPTNINLRQKGRNGESSAYEDIFANFAQTSKEHPATLDLMQEVVNQTDSTTSKYTLSYLPNLMKNPLPEAQAKAAIPGVKAAAEATLEGGYTMDYSKQKDFIGFLQILTSPEAKPEKIKAFPEMLNITSEIEHQNKNKQIIIDPYMLVTNPRPVNEVMENLKTLQASGLYSKMDSKTPFDVAEFANKNINLTV